MLLRVGGSVSILLAAVGMADCLNRELSLHKKQLQEAIYFFELLKNEMCRLQKPLPIALYHCARHLSTQLSICLGELASDLENRQNEDARALWVEKLNSHKNTLLFSEQELQVLEEAGELFVMGTNRLQEELLELYTKRMESCYESFISEYQNRRKLYSSMCVMTGLFVWILLV